RVWKRATNSKHAGSWYHKITISGQEDLRHFHHNVGFSISYKQQRLESLLQHRQDTNVDLVPIDGSQLRWLRVRLGLYQREVADMVGFSINKKGKVAGIRAIEAG